MNKYLVTWQVLSLRKTYSGIMEILAPTEEKAKTGVKIKIHTTQFADMIPIQEVEIAHCQKIKNHYEIK